MNIFFFALWVARVRKRRPQSKSYNVLGSGLKRYGFRKRIGSMPWEIPRRSLIQIAIIVAFRHALKGNDDSWRFSSTIKSAKYKWAINGPVFEKVRPYRINFGHGSRCGNDFISPSAAVRAFFSEIWLFITGNRLVCTKQKSGYNQP